MHLYLLLQATEAAQGEGGGSSLLSPNTGLMVWTFLIFGLVWFILSRFAFPKITEAVRAREEALQAAIDGAKRDRDEAARLLQEQRDAISGARDEATRLLADARAAGETVREKMLGQAHTETADLLDRARKEIVSERDRAIADLRREAIDLAIAGASRVISKNLDDASNRKLVEDFLASIPSSRIAPKPGSTA